MSKYVQRCLGCRKVRGNTAFRVVKAGARAPLCKWCETTAEASANEARAALQPLLREQASLLSRLVRVRSKIRAKEAELLDAERVRRSA